MQRRLAELAIHAHGWVWLDASIPMGCSAAASLPSLLVPSYLGWFKLSAARFAWRAGAAAGWGCAGRAIA